MCCRASACDPSDCPVDQASDKGLLGCPLTRSSTPPWSQDVPTAYAYELEAATIVQSSQVVEAVQRVCGARTPVAARV